MRHKPLSDQVIVIVGASSGIGLATARLAAARGASVVAAARSAGALRALVDELRQRGHRAAAAVADVSSAEQVDSIARVAIEQFGRIDTWVNGAAVSAYGSCQDVSLEDMRRIMDVTYWGTVYGSRVACRHLAAAGGALINVGSVLSDRAVPTQGAYSAAKHAMKGFTDALRVELMHARTPITVTLIKPSAIDTPYAEHARNYFPDQPTHFPPVYTPQAVAEAIVYAAEYGPRDVIVGSTGVVLSWAGRLLPTITDHLMARAFIPALHSGRPPQGRVILDQPGEDLRERGDYQGTPRASVFTKLRLRPRATLMVSGTLFGLAVTALASRRRRRHRLHADQSRRARVQRMIG